MGGACFLLNSDLLISVITLVIRSYLFPSFWSCIKSFFSSIIPFKITSSCEYGGNKSVSNWLGLNSALGGLLRILSPIILLFNGKL